MVTDLHAVGVDAFTWRLVWSSDLADATFWIYRDGALLATTTETSYRVTLEPGSDPVFEVLDAEGSDAPTDEPSPRFPDHIVLAWYAAGAGVSHYRIDRLVDETWFPESQVSERGVGYCRWRSDRLADGQTHRFRVVPVGLNGNDGAATPFAALMVRVPNAPRARYEYHPLTATVTITSL